VIIDNLRGDEKILTRILGQILQKGFAGYHISAHRFISVTEKNTATLDLSSGTQK